MSRDLALRIEANIAGVFVGKGEAVRKLLTAFLAGMHVLIEDLPGVGKTTLARSLAASAGLDFGRLQFTPDLLPGDVIGMTVWSPEKREFLYKEGVVMHQFLLADEINRASPRTQASLLEAMQEGAVSVDGKTYRLPEPFFVLATQNPASFLGTFPLPESELDRFGVSLSLGYPSEAEEAEILGRFQEEDAVKKLQAVTGPREVLEAMREVRQIHVSGRLKGYLSRLAAESRRMDLFRLALSPRASLHLMRAAQGWAWISDRSFIIPEDVRAMAPEVLAHRLVLSPEARMEGVSPREAVARLLNRVPIPTGLDER